MTTPNSNSGDPFHIRTSGQPPASSARRENLVSQILKERMSQQVGSPKGAGRPVASSIFDPPIIQNTTGAAIPAFSVLGISGVAITQDKNDTYFKTKIQFTGETPAAGDDFVITQRPINANEFGICCAWGITPAQVNMVNEDDEWCDIAPGDTTQLQSYSDKGAAQILVTNGGTGKQWCIIRIGGGTPGSTGRRYIMITSVVGNVTGKLAAWRYKGIEVTDNWMTDGTPQAIPGAVEVDVLNMNEGNNAASGIGPMMTCPPVSASEFASGVKCQPLVVGSVWELIAQRTCASTGSGSGSGAGVTTIYMVDAVNIKAECPDGG
jgi:hypothetical protein